MVNSTFVNTKAEGEPVLQVYFYAEFVSEIAKALDRIKVLQSETAKYRVDIIEGRGFVPGPEFLKQNAEHLIALNEFGGKECRGL